MASRESAGGRLGRLLGRAVHAWVHLGEPFYLRTHRGRLGHVLEPALAVLGRTAGPAALFALSALREVHEPVGDLAHLQFLREVAGYRRLFEAVLLQLLDCGEPLVLVFTLR